MAKKSKLSRKNFFDLHPVCCYCGGTSKATTRDHVPARTFFYNKHRPRGFEVPACKRCNELFGKFDDFFAVLAFMQASFSSKVSDPRFAKMVSGCIRRFPEAMRELRERSTEGYFQVNSVLRPGVAINFSHPDLHFTINYQIARIVCAQFYESRGKPLTTDAVVSTFWHSNAQPAHEVRMSEILGKFPYYRTLEQGQWSAEEQFESRFLFDENEELGGCAFHFHRTFTGLGFLFPSAEQMPGEREDNLFLITDEGIQPSDGRFPAKVRLPKRSKSI